MQRSLPCVPCLQLLWAQVLANFLSQLEASANVRSGSAALQEPGDTFTAGEVPRPTAAEAGVEEQRLVEELAEEQVGHCVT